MKNKKFLSVLVVLGVLVAGGVALVVQGQFLGGNMFSKAPLSAYNLPVSGVKPLSVAVSGASISRAQFAELLMKANPLVMKGRVTPECTFSDVSNAIPAKNAISVLCVKGVLKGYADGTFGPAKTVNRAEAAVAFYRTFLFSGPDTSYSGVYTDVQLSSWYALPVNALAHYSVFESGNSSFFPSSSLSVSRAKTWAANAVKNIPSSYWLK